MTGKKIFLTSLAVLSALVTSGCGNDVFMTKDRLENGLVIILPGIEGESGFNHDIRTGLMASGVYRGLQIHSWNRPIPLIGILITQVDFVGNWLAGSGVADMIVKYQDKYPGRPVHLIGHSGGGGVAVFAAAQLPEGRKVDGLILLHASISCDYNLTKALQHSKNGILNVFNKGDVALLGIATTFLGNVDGGRSASAGRAGFDPPRAKDKEEKKLAYEKVYQLELTNGITGGGDSHAAATKVPFIVDYIAEWITTPNWPPESMKSLAYVLPPEQPKEQQTSQPTEQSQSQPSSSQPTSQPEEQSQDESTTQPEEQSQDQDADQPASQPSTQPEEQSTEQTTSQPSSQPAESSDDQQQDDPDPDMLNGDLI